MTTLRKNQVAANPEATLAGLVALAQQSLSLSEGQPDEADAGLVRFERAVARHTLGRRRGGLYWALACGAAAATATVALMMTLRPPGSSLTFDVVNGTIGSGGYVRANAGGTALRFSDGSTVALDPGTGARVGDVDARGGRVQLESGRARVHVTPRRHANWTVDAGPYSVHVVGTEFDIGWSSNEEVLDLHLLKGSIVVRGPLARDGLSMDGGAHLFANVRKGEIHLDGPPASGLGETAGAAPATGEPAPPEPAPPGATSHETTGGEPALAAHGSRTTPVQPTGSPARARQLAASETGSKTGREKTGRETGWDARFARGDFQGVLADAERRGLDDVFATSSPSDLTVLADAARFARRGNVARAALLAERARFPRSPQAREAAFFLGGLSQDQGGEAAMKTALDWYDTYLRESPGGAFVRAVWGRRMALVQKLRGTAAARPLAIEYLQRFSDGPYAGSARKLLEEP